MAEDEADIEDQNEEDEEDIVGRRIKKDHKESRKQKKCNTRIDQLATPNRRLILALWEQHGHRFEKQRAEKLKAKLQEMYAMTPEETEKYFEKLRAEMKKQTWRKYMRDKLRKLVAKKRKIQKQRKAYALLRKLLRQVMTHAFSHEPPVLVSTRLRLLSEIILEHICDLRGVEVPDRATSVKLGKFLIAVSDWFAIGVENMYFTVQVKKNEELEEIEKGVRVETLTGSIDFQPPATSTPRESIDFQPVATSTPRQSIEFQPLATSTPRQSIDKTP